jgi:hypothetical protein
VWEARERCIAEVEVHHDKPTNINVTCWDHLYFNYAWYAQNFPTSGTATTSAAEVELGEVLEPDALLAH